MSQDCQKSPLEAARIDWQDTTPFSVQFADVYFSRDDGAAESRHVFLEQNQLPQRWQEWAAPGSFVIAETGFGTGLNFFCAWELWQQTRQPGQHLHFVSVEKFPLQHSDMERACALQPHFSAQARALLDQYPPLLGGMHHLHFLADSITLTLIFDDASNGLAQLDGVVDAWFLDGFAPARNPHMWQPQLFTHMARLSHGETTFATFTSAGIVKRGLREAGFVVHKHQGFGRKRDMLKGHLAGSSPATQWAPAQSPWFRFDYRRRTPGQVAIVGAGLAGCSAAHALAQRGWQVHLLERDTQIANQASGNATGITYARLSQHDTAQNRYYIGAYLFACRFIRQVFEQANRPPGSDWNLNGVLQLAFDAEEEDIQRQLQQSGRWPDDVARFLDPGSVTDHLGFSTELGATLMRQGGWLNPATLCATLSAHPRIQVHTQADVQQLQRQDEQWWINDLATGFDAVVLANTFEAASFAFADHLPLRWVRGQVTHVPATLASATLQHAVNYDGYINPARDGFHCVGATFNPRDRDPSQRSADHQHNLSQLHNAVPSLAAALNLPDPATLHGRVGFRCQTPDYVPVVGPLPDHAAFAECFADVSKGFLKRDFPACPVLPGLYITTAFGAKGITGAPLAAEILASYITGEPQPVDRDVVFALHPARFLQRALKRRQPP